MIKSLRDAGIIEEAEKKGFHETADTLLSQVLDPIRRSVHNALQHAFAQMGLAVGWLFAITSIILYVVTLTPRLCCLQVY